MGFLQLWRQYQISHEVDQGSPIFHSSFKGELGIALESLQGKIDLIEACVQDLDRKSVV